MFKAITIIAASVLVSGAAFSTAALADATPRVDQRQQHQAARIRQGLASGELTRAEAKRLLNGQQHVRGLERRAKADGDVTARERARLEHANDVQSRRIYRQKHDAQTRN